MNARLQLIVTLIAVILLYGLLVSAYDTIVDALFSFESASAGLMRVLVQVALLYLVLIPWMRFFYQENLFDYLGQKPRNWRADFNLAQVFLVGLFLLSEPLFLWLNWRDLVFEWQSDWRNWALWLLPLLAVIFLQTSAEEFAFRGLFQHKLQALGAARWVYIGVPALFWALIHQSMVGTPILKIGIVLQMFVIGLILGDWVARVGHIRGAIWVHFFLNTFTMLIYGSSLRPTANAVLYVDVSGLSPMAQFSNFILAALAAILCYVFLVRRRLKGKDDFE